MTAEASRTLAPSGCTFSALLVDPSLFTAPYDAALTQGLLSAGVEPTWAVRPTRPGDREEIPPERVAPFFYRRSEGLRVNGAVRAALKGIEHVWGLGQLLRRVYRSSPDVVHFQWTVLPPLDALSMLTIRRRCPVVLTVHDTVPFNGEHVSLLQNMVWDLPLRLCDQIIVHTEAGRHRLIARGIAEQKIAVIPHGPLALVTRPGPSVTTDGRWTGVLFGELKHYKGIDLLIEAVAQLPPAIRRESRFIVAGRPRMDLAPLERRVAELDLGDVISFVPHRLNEQEMADLFHVADCFVFPYRQIDASGVYFLVKSLGKWIVATRVGVFAEDLQPGTRGELVQPEDVESLSQALARAIAERPTARVESVDAQWTEIGAATRSAYERAVASGR